MIFNRFLVFLVLLITLVSTLSSAQPSVPSSEIIAKVQNSQPIEYSNITIVGYLDLSTLRIPAIKSDFSIINSTISNATFDGVTFEKEAIFWGSTFRNASFNKTTFSANSDFSNASFGRASFTGAAFSLPVIFDGAEFLGGVSFVDSQFQKDASFNEARFLGDANFNYSTFGYYTYFSGAQFSKDARFSSVKFQGPLDFSAANITGVANFFDSQFSAASFSNSIFLGPARFGLTRFAGLSSFGGTLFSGEASFVLARFSDAAYFSQAHFNDSAILGLVKFEDIASFQNVVFDRQLNLKSAQISTMLLENSRFGKNSKINLNDSDFNRFKARWDQIKDYVIYDPGVYLALIDNYRGLGWHKDEDDCYYSYRRLEQSGKEIGWSKALDVMAWLSCGYGVRPGYTAIWVLITIFIYALIFWMGDGIRRSAKPLQESPEIDIVPERATLKNALFFSTMVFLSQGPIDFLPVGKNRYHVIMEGILGWLLLALFLVTLGRIMIR
jgi:uncharacterized protein YjbI with pentapeptide repeats